MNGTGIIYTDDTNEATRALFGRTLPTTQNFIESTVTNYCNRLGQGMSSFADDVMSRFKNFNNIYVLNRIENIRHSLNSVWQADAIKPLKTLHEIQHSPASMQRWIMAHPQVRTSYNRSGCNGYEGSYKDIRPGGVGKDHYDYRRVMNGVVENKVYNNYHEPILNQADLLVIFEKNSIRQTWKVLDSLLQNGNNDPTDPWSNGTIV